MYTSKLVRYVDGNSLYSLPNHVLWKVGVDRYQIIPRQDIIPNDVVQNFLQGIVYRLAACDSAINLSLRLIVFQNMQNLRGLMCEVLFPKTYMYICYLIYTRGQFQTSCKRVFRVFLKTSLNTTCIYIQ